MTDEQRHAPEHLSDDTLIARLNDIANFGLGEPAEYVRDTCQQACLRLVELILARSDTEAPERTLAKYISTRDAALEEAAEECLRLWKTASNNRASGYWQNALSHGCVASAKAIRALKTAAPQAGSLGQSSGAQPGGDDSRAISGPGGPAVAAPNDRCDICRNLPEPCPQGRPVSAAAADLQTPACVAATRGEKA
jgi:hypothetical protein